MYVRWLEITAPYRIYHWHVQIELDEFEANNATQILGMYTLYSTHALYAQYL